MKADWFLAVAERTVMEGSRARHECCLVGVYSDIDKCNQAVQRYADTQRDHRVYLYFWPRSEMPRFIGIATHEMRRFTMLNYGRSFGIGQMECLLLGFHMIYLEEMPDPSSAELVGELCEGIDGSNRCVAGCGAVVSVKGTACDRCQRDAISANS